MTIRVTIEDGVGSNGAAAIVKKEDTPSGLIAYTIPYLDRIGQIKAAVNSIYGADMNINAAFSGTPENVHNGADNVYWTATALTGTWTFNSTTQAYTGTRSIDATATVNNDEAQFASGGTISTGSYVALTGAIYISAWATTGVKNVSLRLRNAGVDVGTAVNISTYINTATLGSWQPFVIPISAFGAGVATVNQLVVRTISTGGGTPPDYYLDALRFEQQGSLAYTITPDQNTIYEINNLRVTMADAYDSTLANSSVPDVPYNALLAVAALTNGLQAILTTNNVVRFNATFKRHIDFMALPGMVTTVTGDATNTVVAYDIPLNPPIVMDSRTHDNFTFTIADDLSGLLYLRITCRGSKIEL